VTVDSEAPRTGASWYPGDAGSAAKSTFAVVDASSATALLTDPQGFRTAAAALTAVLLRKYGTGQWDTVEDAVQDAFVAAVRTWPVSGAPTVPLAWLTRVANRRYLDRLRAGRRLVADDGQADQMAASAPEETAEDTPLGDDQLRLLFMCCHPALSADSRVALTLKCVAQLSVPEIARLLRAEESAVAQRLVRAKRTLRDTQASFVVPSAAEVPARLDDALAVCYALFAEGHLATGGDTLVRGDLCQEALRLVTILTQWPETAQPPTHALLALLCFTAARLPARADGDDVVSLREQDRSRWDARLIARGVRALEASARGTQFTRYHAEAEIAAAHSLSRSWADTPWDVIVAAYDRLLMIAPSPIARLSRLVALAEGGNVLLALDALQADAAVLLHWPEWHAVQGTLLARAGEYGRAVDAFNAALALPASQPVQRYWTGQRDAALAAAAGGMAL
jgi:RNA polymerase sigma-70 factor, ECF subfamily